MPRTPKFLFGLALIAGTWAGGTAHAQCPADFTLTYPDRPDSLSPYALGVMTAITRFDQDGTGPLAPITIGAFYAKFNDCFGINHEISRIDRWDTATSTWVPMTGVFDGIVRCMTAFDEDQSGPNQPRLYIGGRFSGFGAPGGAVVPSPNIMRYDGAAFTGVRNGLNGDINALLVFDDDATGPVLPKLYLGGGFSAAHSSGAQGQVNANRLIRLTGSLLWENPTAGGGFDDWVFALCSYDEDGPGAGIPKLAVGGAFSNNNGDNNQRLVALYNGSTWSPLSQGLDRMVNAFGSGRRVFALAEFDEDGTGVNLPSLFVGGSIYQTAQGQVSPLVIRWKKHHVTGVSSWISCGPASGLVTQPSSDSCANFCSNTPTEGNRPRVTCFMPFDADGSGVNAPELYIGGDIHGDIGNGLMKWNLFDECQWVIGASGRDFHLAPAVDSQPGAVYPSMALAMMSVPGNASVPPSLAIAGGFMELRTCGGGVFYWNTFYAPTFLTTTWTSGGSGPTVTNQPDNTWSTFPVVSGGFAININGTAPFTYQWRKDGINLVNGTGQGYGGIIGATGSAVILGGTANPINTMSQGWYDCRVSNACGTGYTNTAWLVVQPDATPYFPIRFDSPVAPVTTMIGNADLRYIYVGAAYPRFFTYVGDTPFAIAPTGSNAWRGSLAAGSPTGNRSVTIPTNNAGIGEVYTLLNTDGASATNVRFQFTASGGLVYNHTLAGGNQIRSYSTFYGPQTVTSEDTSNVFNNGLTVMDKQRILLPNAFRTRTLTSITITDLGTDSTGRAILAGLTLRQRPPACGSADLGGVGGIRGADGVLDNNDFVVFVNLFFGNDFTADVGMAGGLSGPDGVLDNNDFVAFINAFFGGC